MDIVQIETAGSHAQAGLQTIISHGGALVELTGYHRHVGNMLTSINK